MGDALDGGALDRWRREPAAFITEVLRDPETGRPFDLLQSELRFLDHCFRTNGSERLSPRKAARRRSVRSLH
jgi:hypothetical protein